MKKLSIFICLLLSGLSQLSAQDGYIVTDTMSRFGLDIESGTRKSRSYKVTVIEIIRKEKYQVTYTPDVILAYGVDNKEYESKEIELNGEKLLVFLEKVLTSDSITLWCYGGASTPIYFMQTGGQMRQMTKDNFLFKTYLEGCPHIKDEYTRKQVGKMGLNRYSMKRINRAVSTNNKNLFNRFRWGLLAGGGIGNLHIEYLDLSPDYHLYAGLFANTPLRAELSLQTELYYIKDVYSQSTDNNTTLNDFIYNKESLQMPLMLRYRFARIPRRGIPYIQIGATCSYTLKDKIQYRSSHKGTDKVILPPSYRSSETPSFVTGYTFGAGYELRLNNKHSLFMDLRYTHLPDRGQRSLSQLFATLSFNL